MLTPAEAQVFVYYRVQPADAAAVIAAVRTLQAGLQARMPGLTCTLSRRADDASGFLTLMEAYSHAGAVAADWRDDIERGAHEALAGRIVGERHVEVFVPCA